MLLINNPNPKHSTPSNIRDIAKLLLDLTDSLEISSTVEGISTEEEKFDEVTSNITSSHIQTACEMGKGETIKHRDDVGNTITTIYHHTSQETFKLKKKV